MVVKSIDVRYLNREVKAANRFYRITRPNPVMDSALECAGFHLNELGMNLYHAAILELEKRIGHLLLVSTRVEGRVSLVCKKCTGTKPTLMV